MSMSTRNEKIRVHYTLRSQEMKCRKKHKKLKRRLTLDYHNTAFEG